MGWLKILLRHGINVGFTFIFLMETRVAGEMQQVGYSATSRRNSDSVKKAILITDPSTSISIDGLLVGWHVYFLQKLRNMPVELQVWRPIPHNTRIVYNLIGSTQVVSLWEGHVYFLLHPEDRITVKSEDVIGIYFRRQNPIPWTPVSCHGNNKHLFSYNPRHIVIGGKTFFTTSNSDWIPCRAYSYNATVMTLDAADRLDRRSNIKYGEKPYGPYLPAQLPAVHNEAHSYIQCPISLQFILLLIFEIFYIWNINSRLYLLCGNCDK